MFFPRLRRQAKWVFLFLALVFALGFVGFGVGAGGVGVGDIFRDAGGASGVPSVSDGARSACPRTRSDPQAFRDLATAQQADGNTDGAIEALEELVALRPEGRGRAPRARRPLPREGRAKHSSGRRSRSSARRT